MRSETLVTITGTHLRESPKAILFRIDQISAEPLEKSKEEWIPFSQIRKITTDSTTEGKDSLVVTEWILKQKELI